MSTYIYTKTPVSLERLALEISLSSITVGQDTALTSLFGSQLTIGFKADLSEGEVTTLNDLVSAHTGAPLIITPPVQPVTLAVSPEPQPFALPTHRTKHNAAGWATCPAGEATVLDYQLTAERYVSGGQLIYKNIKEGDYLSAEVYDKDNLIPAPYRAASAEAHPCVAKYIIKKFIKPNDGYDTLTIETFPLNAKIPAGFYLRMTLITTAEAGDRRIAINYHLTKKL